MPISAEQIDELLGMGCTSEQIRELVLADLELKLSSIKAESDLLSAQAQLAEQQIAIEMPKLALVGYENSAPRQKEK